MMTDADGHRLVIFDCDGVLVDSEMLASGVLSGVLTDLGYRITPEQSRDRFTGMSIPSIVAAVEAEWGRPLPADFEDSLRREDLAVFTRELKPVPGIAEAVARITLPKCVASSGAPEKIRHSLTVTGLLGYFEPHLFSAHMVARGKPAPDLFLHAARQMRAVPEDCCVIEDTPLGIEAARAAGMRVLGFAGGSHCDAGTADRLRRAGADAVFDRMAELPELLAQRLSG